MIIRGFRHPLVAAMPANPETLDSALQGALPLADWGVIRAAGDDARSFLHGQLTQDTLHLEAGSARLAGYCSVKGRLLASFVVWRRAPEEVFLACSADLLPATLKRLSMFVMRAKCKLTDASVEVALWGLAGDAATSWLGPQAPATVWARADMGSAVVIRLPDAVTATGPVPRYLWAAPTAEPAPDLPALDADAWRWLEVHSGVVRISAATSEQFVPQMVNLELVGGVNFQKGCYPGQEIVARSQYRGTLKRRAFVVESGTALRPGQEVFHSADPEQPAGMVALAGSAAGHHAALVELKIAATEGGVLAAGAADGTPLRLGALPYGFPAEAA
jgi:tRNA-modifying protein YgfZ